MTTSAPPRDARCSTSSSSRRRRAGPAARTPLAGGLVFETGSLKAVKKFLGEGKNEIFQQGAETWDYEQVAGENWRLRRLPRGRRAGRRPDSVQKGWGISARGVRPAPSTPPTRRLAG